MRAWLRTDAVSLSIPREGLWIGRSPDCDLVVDDHRISQVHALVTARADRLEVYPLGRNPTEVNGEPLSGRRTLRDGDELSVPGGRWTVEIPEDPPRPPWVAVLPGGLRVGLGTRTVTLGGGPSDDVRISGWPSGALTLHRAPGGALLVESGTPALEVAGEALEVGALEEVVSGTRVRCGGAEVALIALASGRPATTVLALDAGLPTEVRFRFTATGGELQLRFPRTEPGREPVVDLPELRARLVAALLASPNDEVEDEDVIAAVWPGAVGRTRLDVNQLVHRARKDLLAAGVDPTPLLVRSRRGGAARFAVARGARVTVE